MRKEKIHLLTLASREFGMAVDCMYWPPSDRGTVKQLLRKGHLIKKRGGSKTSRRSTVYVTEKGAKWLKKCSKKP